MCNLYQMTPKEDFERYARKLNKTLVSEDYDASRPVGPFGQGMFLTLDGNQLRGTMGQWGMIRPGQSSRIDYIQPKAQPGKKPPAPRARSTNNARIEGIDGKPTFSRAWKLGQRCLIPADWYQEPNWETGKNIWWQLKRADGLPWTIAGLWSEWTDQETGELVPNFTMITRNCTGHPLLGRLHKPELDPSTKKPLSPEQEDKRSLVHIAPEDWTRWLTGSIEEATQLLTLPEPEFFDQADARRTDELLQSHQSLF